MTGPEHYAEAEELIHAHRAETDMDMRTLRLVEAQVHATLALAAATALGMRSSDSESIPAGMHHRDFAAWDDVAGVPL